MVFRDDPSGYRTHAEARDISNALANGDARGAQMLLQRDVQDMMFRYQGNPQMAAYEMSKLTRAVECEQREQYMRSGFAPPLQLHEQRGYDGMPLASIDQWTGRGWSRVATIRAGDEYSRGRFDPRYGDYDARYEGYDPRYGGRYPRYAGRDPRYEGYDPRYEGYDPRYSRRDPRYGGYDPRYIGYDPRYAGYDSRPFDRYPVAVVSGAYDSYAYQRPMPIRYPVAYPVAAYPVMAYPINQAMFGFNNFGGRRGGGGWNISAGFSFG